MGPDDFQSYLDDLLTRLQGIEDAVATAPAPAAVPTMVAPADPLPLIVAIVLGAVAVIVAAVALMVTRQTARMLRTLRPDVAAADPRLEQRREYATLLRRYSELLGVELVTGRGVVRGDTAVDLRVRLEERLATLRQPGAVELLDEVGDARAALPGLPTAQRAAANGIAAMGVEWSIDRWVADPRAWLADCREHARLEALGARREDRVAAAS